MTESLQRLLEQAIDYAGLFPPAQLGMPDALKEYHRQLNGPNEWLVDRFVCPAARLDEAVDAAAHLGLDDLAEELPVTVVAAAITDGQLAAASLDRDLESIAGCRKAICSAFELRVPSESLHLGPTLKALKSRWSQFEDVEVFLEVPWGPDQTDAMHQCVAAIEEVGFKARTGGTTPEAFPTTGELAAWIAEVSGLEVPYKFTAGLHDPLPHFDRKLGARHHGFLNVLGATACAMIFDLGVADIERILTTESPADFRFAPDGAFILGYELDLADLDTWWEWCGGFGSCSVDEPVEGLARLGLL